MNIESLQKEIEKTNLGLDEVVRLMATSKVHYDTEIWGKFQWCLTEIEFWKGKAAALQAAESETQTFKDYCLIKDLEIGKLNKANEQLIAENTDLALQAFKAEEENKRLREGFKDISVAYAMAFETSMTDESYWQEEIKKLAEKFSKETGK